MEALQNRPWLYEWKLKLQAEIMNRIRKTTLAIVSSATGMAPAPAVDIGRKASWGLALSMDSDASLLTVALTCSLVLPVGKRLMGLGMGYHWMG